MYYGEAVMETIILIIHVLLGVALVALVLIQQGKGASMGASFGAGASQTVFGSTGGGSLLTRITTGLAMAFFATSISLAVIAKNRADGEANPLHGLPAIEQGLPSATEGGEIPAQGLLPDRSATDSADVKPSDAAPVPAGGQSEELPKVETGPKQ
ncbi:MAG TPA: preprotein translocase subunit SecG [Pseudomonadales bacterium]|nr:preprotein translocase subunit SecG [Pseudomonadales bacterium]